MSSRRVADLPFSACIRGDFVTFTDGFVFAVFFFLSSQNRSDFSASGSAEKAVSCDFIGRKYEVRVKRN